MSDQSAVPEGLGPRFATDPFIEWVASWTGLPYEKVAIMLPLAEDENPLRSEEFWKEMIEADLEQAVRLAEAAKAG